VETQYKTLDPEVLPDITWFNTRSLSKKKQVFTGWVLTSGVEDFQWMLRYLDSLDETNAKILEGLGVHGPRNISSLAKTLRLPSTTVAFRLLKLVRENGLQIRARLNFQKLGLRKAVVFAEAKPGKEKILRNLVDNLSYWTYMIRCFGKFNGVYALFGFPEEFREKLEDYFAEASRLGLLDNYALYWVTDFCEKPPNFSWFDFKRRGWSFQWQRWIKEIERDSEGFPKKLLDPEAYVVLADKVDLLLLKELEKDGSTEFKALAKVVDMTPEAVRYRFQNHIIKRQLIADYEISIFPYPYQSSDMSCFVIEFKTKEALAKFVNSLSDKPFILNYAKVVGQNALVVHFYVPKIEFSNLVDSLNSLVETHFVERFFHVSLDISSYQRQTVSYEFFENNKWTYNHESAVGNLKKILSE
jgi:DNA-binding Lrp family transcriptional regulator